MKRRFATIALLAGALVLPAAAQAQAWPSKTIRIVVNFPPGGAADQIARSVAAAAADGPRPDGGGREPRRLGRQHRR